MRVLQINAVYEKFSTGRVAKELHEYLLKCDMESYVASPNLNGLNHNGIQIGNRIDSKVHAFLSRIWGLQGYFSYLTTKQFLKQIKALEPDVVILHNLHNNCINLQLLLKFLAKESMPTVLVLHDSWFYTGKCVYYIEDVCDGWKYSCGNCPALRKGNKSWLFDRSRKMLADKRKWFSKISRLGVIGVSQWVTDDASISILKEAKIIRCIYNWIDLKLFAPRDREELKAKAGKSGKFIILGVAMSWNHLKGSQIFHDLADLLSDSCEIWLVGENSEIKNTNDKINYIGIVNDVKKLAELYAMADVFVNPSIQETFGKTTAEAMACGTPVVAYDGTATTELVGRDEACGYLINEMNAQKFCEKINVVLKKGVEAYATACRNRAEELFDKEKNIKEYLEIIKELQESKG